MANPNPNPNPNPIPNVKPNPHPHPHPNPNPNPNRNLQAAWRARSGRKEVAIRRARQKKKDGRYDVFRVSDVRHELSMLPQLPSGEGRYSLKKLTSPVGGGGMGGGPGGDMGTLPPRRPKRLAPLGAAGGRLPPLGGDASFPGPLGGHGGGRGLAPITS